MSELNKEEKRETIAAIVVTYNRKELLIECLDALMKQTYPLDEIFIIDNASLDGTPELLIEKGYINKALSPDTEPIEDIKTIKLHAFERTVDIHYVRMLENTGGAGGFHKGVKRGYEAGHDWLWLMDDDVKADAECLAKLVEGIFSIKNRNEEMPAALACARFSSDNHFIGIDCKKLNITNPFLTIRQTPVQKVDLRQIILKVEGITFEGMMLNNESVAKIGFPDKRFFIAADDTDYCLRLLKTGSIYYIPSAKLMRLVSSKRLGNRYIWKSYYVIRNRFYLDLKYANKQTKTIRLPYTILRLIMGRLYHRDFRKGLLTILRASFDAVKMYRQPYNYFE